MNTPLRTWCVATIIAIVAAAPIALCAKASPQLIVVPIVLGVIILMLLEFKSTKDKTKSDTPNDRL